jgi:hypothetical protein
VRRLKCSVSHSLRFHFSDQFTFLSKFRAMASPLDARSKRRYLRAISTAIVRENRRLQSSTPRSKQIGYALGLFLHFLTQKSAVDPLRVGLGLEVPRWITTRRNEWMPTVLSDNRRPCAQHRSFIESRLPSRALKQSNSKVLSGTPNYKTRCWIVSRGCSCFKL